MSSLNVLPLFSGDDLVDLNERDIVMHGNRTLRHALAVEFTYVEHRLLSKFTHRMSLTRIIGAVQFLVLLIFRWCSPDYMGRIYANIISAKVRGMRLVWRLWSIRVDAHEASDRNHSAVFSDVWATMRIGAIRPINAVFGMLGFGVLKKGSCCMSLCSHMLSMVTHNDAEWYEYIFGERDR